jgi:sugar/nucleoside kinase (ribokinase family)
MTDEAASGPVLVVGDLLLDVVVVPEQPLRRDALSLDHARARITFDVGGAGANLALAAADLGVPRVDLVTGVSLGHELGALAAGLLDRVRDRGIRVIANEVPAATGGATVIVYLDGHRRMMLADPGACEEPLTPRTHALAVRAIASASLVVVSGHSLFRARSRPDALALIRAARDAGVPVALDLVPHSAYRTTSLVQLRSYLDGVTFLSAAADTLLAFHDRPRWPDVGERGMLATTREFLDRVDGLLVFLPDLGHRVVDRDGVSVTPAPDLPPGTRLPGYTDRVLMGVLLDRYRAR